MGDRSDEALTESAVDREIERALAVDPSPEFLARVRARVASEPAPAGWRFRWVFAGGAVMALVIAIVVVLSGPDQTTSPMSTSPAAATGQGSADTSVRPLAKAVTEQPVAPARPREVSPVVSGFSRTVGAGFSRTVAAGGATEPHVLISPEEAAALRRLFADASEGRLVFASLVTEPPPATMALQPLSEIVFPPITIEPLIPVDYQEGVRQ